MHQICEDNVLPKIQISFTTDSENLHIEIETQRLYIRSYQNQDFEDCVILYGDESLTKFFDDGKPRSREEVANFIREKAIKYFKQGEPFGLFSIFRKEDMAFIGLFDLMPYDEPGIVEIGCIFSKKFHNQGFCPEAVRAMIFNYVDELNLRNYKCNGLSINRVLATAHPENHASKRIIKNLGMVLEKSQDRFGYPRLWYYLNTHSIKSHN